MSPRCAVVAPTRARPAHRWRRFRAPHWCRRRSAGGPMPPNPNTAISHLPHVRASVPHRRNARRSTTAPAARSGRPRRGTTSRVAAHRPRLRRRRRAHRPRRWRVVQRIPMRPGRLRCRQGGPRGPRGPLRPCRRHTPTPCTTGSTSRCPRPGSRFGSAEQHG